MSLCNKLVNFVILTLLLLGVTAKSPSRHLSSVISSRGLYDGDSKVTVLNATNFKTSVFHTSNAWLIEFYSSWCGFCQRFAPTWKEVAASTYGWKDVMITAAIDCANEDNTPVCREYEVMKYPTIKFFRANTKAGDLGTEVKKGNTADDIVHSAVDFLKKEQTDGRGLNWPNIAPYRSSDVQNLWKNAPESIQNIFLIFEESGSHIGPEVVLDLQRITKIQVRYVLNENEALAKLLGITVLPSLIVLERNNVPLPLSIGDKTRDDFRKAIKTFLTSKGIITIIDEQQEDQKHKDNDVSSIQAVGDIKRKFTHDEVFQADLELALQYSLKHEIPMKTAISGKSLDALRNYLSVLVKYFPTEKEGKTYLQILHDKALNSVELLGKDFLSSIKDLEQNLKHPPFISNRNWVGCRGSAPNYRGYPCGLWTLFHTLTVNSVLQNGTDRDFKSLEVLDAMLGYVTHFFGCDDCSMHFQSMAAENMHSDVVKPEDSIMWLWKAHNKANKRLAGDMTDDPTHPKIQFPSKDNCPVCRDSDGNWKYNEVLKYLEMIYGKDTIKQISAEDRYSDNLSGSSLQIGHLQNNNFVELNKSAAKSQHTGWNFNIFDMSICVFLYLVSASILLTVFFKFVVKKRYKKKHYVHDLLGKV